MNVKPIAPPLGWYGGKSLLAKDIIARIKEIPHMTYAEVFFGVGNVFFRREEVPRYEIINDRSGEVVNFFRILQRHYPQFMDFMKFQVSSRSDFDRLVASEPKLLTDLERASRFLYLQKMGFGGKIVGQTCPVRPVKPTSFNTKRLAPKLEKLHERLSDVTIENLDFEDFIRRYDREQTFFYLDPPYYGTEGAYGKELFCRDDFLRLKTCLKDLKGRFIMSLNDHATIREIYKDFNIQEIPHTWTMSSKRQKVVELLISN